MLENKRHNFRMDVELPLFIQCFEGLESSQQDLSIDSISATQRARVTRYSQHLDTLFSDEKHLENGASQLFLPLSQRLDFLAWLMDLLLQGKNPMQQADFYPRLDSDRLHSLPQGNGNSKVFPLIHAFFFRVDEIIASLLEAIELSVNGHVFLYFRPVSAPFDANRYVHNIDSLAEKGSWLAQVLQHLVFKLNVYEVAYLKLKEQYKDASYPERWPMQLVNLSGGGIAIEAETVFVPSSDCLVLMQIHQRIIRSQVKVIEVLNIGLEQPSQGHVSRYRISFSFEDLDSSDQAEVVQFVSEQELVSVHPELK